MSGTTFWGSLNFNGASAIGVAGVNTRPYTLLSGGSSGMAPQVLADAAAIFPEFDGTTNLALPLPTDYASPSLSGFLNWHSAHQIQFLKEQTAGWAAGDLRIVTFGTSIDPVDNDTFMLSSDGKRVIRVATLQVTEIARLPLADQEMLAELPAFRAFHSNPLGLWPADDVFNVATSGGTAPPATVAEARSRIESDIIGPFVTAVELSGHYSAARRNETVTAANMGDLFANLILDQVDMLRGKLAKMAIFNPDGITTIIADLKKRFDRLVAYTDVTSAVARPTGYLLTESVNSIDSLAGVKSALSVFLQSEMRLRDLALSSYEIADTGLYRQDRSDPTATGREVDTPLMVFLFQTQDNYADEADAQARSQELEQLKAVIDTYTRIQRMVNETLQKFDPISFQKANEGKTDVYEVKKFLGLETVAEMDSKAQYGATDLLVVSMFDKALSTANSNSFLPVEKDTNAGRPSFVIADAGESFVAHKQQDWDLFSKNLSNVSKVLSAEAQARMDEINRISKEKNRHYEIATETVGKMTEILRAIVN